MKCIFIKIPFAWKLNFPTEKGLDAYFDMKNLEQHSIFIFSKKIASCFSDLKLLSVLENKPIEA